jgi:hypothetical protein
LVARKGHHVLQLATGDQHVAAGALPNLSGLVGIRLITHRPNPTDRRRKAWEDWYVGRAHPS